MHNHRNPPRFTAPTRPWLRVGFLWLMQTVALIGAALLLGHVRLDSIWAALWAVAILGLLNALLWPLLSYVLIPFAVYTLGFGALLLNGLLLYFASGFVSGLTIDGYWSAFWLALIMSGINIILSSLVTIDDDHSWYRNVVKRRMNRIAKPQRSDEPGVLMLEIDGLSHEVMLQALAGGFMPTMQRWLDTGSHRLTPWETDTSSQTSASQAGLLHGNNADIPAFRWFDKELGKVVASSDTKILPLLEKARSNGAGLLAKDGASRGNLFSGDAPYVMNTASTLRDRSRFRSSEFQAYFADPYNASRTILLFFWDVVLEWRQFRQARKKDVQPRLDKHHRGGIYPLIRATMTVLMRELNIYTLVGDVFAGRSSAYATFVGYDEIAHHSGILDPGAFDVLYKLDQQFRRLESALREAPRPYHILVLSDHGQTAGATFKQRYGLSLQDMVQTLMNKTHYVLPVDHTGEDTLALNTLLTDASSDKSSTVSQIITRVFAKHTKQGDVAIGLKKDTLDSILPSTKDSKAEVVVLASGNLGLISFPQWKRRATLEQIETSFPALIPGLVQHEGIGFVMLRSKAKGTVVVGAEGTYELNTDRVTGKNPLRHMGARAADHLRRTDSYKNCPDILLNSFYDPETGEGCAFEELIGFHGGLGGPQMKPFILHPTELQITSELVGAEQVHAVLKKWIATLQPA